MWGVFSGWRRFRHTKCYFCGTSQPEPEGIQHLCSSCRAEWRINGESRGHWVQSGSAVTAADVAPRQESVPKKKSVDHYLDQLVVAFLFLPTFPWAMWLFGQEEAPASAEIPGLLVLAVVMWTIALAVGWHAGGRDYVVGSLCWALMLTVTVPWLFVLLGMESAPRGDSLTRVVIATFSAAAVAMLLARGLRLWPFEDKDTRAKRHEVTVMFVDPRDGSYEPYYIAICDCGWMGDFHDTEEPAFHDAYSHTPNVDTKVFRPLEEVEVNAGETR